MPIKLMFLTAKKGAK